jgi:hypothetical protein
MLAQLQGRQPRKSQVKQHGRTLAQAAAALHAVASGIGPAERFRLLRGGAAHFPQLLVVFGKQFPYNRYASVKLAECDPKKQQLKLCIRGGRYLCSYTTFGRLWPVNGST